jgi:hypothetical protein
VPNNRIEHYGAFRAEVHAGRYTYSLSIRTCPQSRRRHRRRPVELQDVSPSQKPGHF